MNERIKQLAEQAEKYADDNFKGQPTYSEAYDSKFAELIVQECLSNMENCDGDLDFAIWKTKKDFGVEE